MQEPKLGSALAQRQFTFSRLVRGYRGAVLPVFPIGVAGLTAVLALDLLVHTILAFGGGNWSGFIGTNVL